MGQLDAIEWKGWSWETGCGTTSTQMRLPASFLKRTVYKIVH